MNNVLTIIKKEFARFFKDKRLVLSTLILPGLLIFLLYTLMGSVFTGSTQTYTAKVVNPSAVFGQIVDGEESGALFELTEISAEELDAAKEEVKAEIIMRGDRPAGTQPSGCPIVKAAWEAALLLGIEPELRDESSTDANIPISLGIPALTVGRGGREGKVHTVQEWFEPVEAWLGPQKDLLLVLGLCGMEGVTEPVLEKRNRKQ